MFTYSRANTPLDQSEHPYYFSYFVKDGVPQSVTKIVDTLSQLLKRTLLSTISSIYHTIRLNRIRWLVAS